MPGPQLDQTAMGGAGRKAALGNKFGVNARNSMTVDAPATKTTTSGGGRGWFGFKKGGIVPGKGNKDSVKAKLTPGEMVVPKRKVKATLKATKGKAGAYEPLRPKQGPGGLMEG